MSDELQHHTNAHKVKVEHIRKSRYQELISELVFESRLSRGGGSIPGGRGNICKALEQSKVKDKLIRLHEIVG